MLTSLVICFPLPLSTRAPRSAIRKAMCFFLCVSKITSVKEAAALFEACQEILQIVFQYLKV